MSKRPDRVGSIRKFLLQNLPRYEDDQWMGQGVLYQKIFVARVIALNGKTPQHTFATDMKILRERENFDNFKFREKDSLNAKDATILYFCSKHQYFYKLGP